MNATRCNRPGRFYAQPEVIRKDSGNEISQGRSTNRAVFHDDICLLIVLDLEKYSRNR